MSFRIPWGRDHHIRFHRPWVERQDGPRPMIEVRPNVPVAPAANTRPPRNAALPVNSGPRDAPSVFQRTLNLPGRQFTVALDQASATRILNQAGAPHAALVRAAYGAASTAQTTADAPALGQYGVMDFSFRHGGRIHEASFEFDNNGAVRGLQITTNDFRELVNVSLPSSGGSNAATDPARALSIPFGLRARVDVQGAVQRRTEGNKQVYAYTPQRDHGLVVQMEPGGVMNLKLVMANPATRGTLGSGTDMFLGVAKALIADGVLVSHVKAQWLDEPGRDSQFKVIEAADEQGGDLAQAASQMFSGKQARRYGFSEVQVSRIQDGYEATFRRPNTPNWFANLWTNW